MKTPAQEQSRLEFYQLRISKLDGAIQHLQSRSDLISRARLVLFILTILLTYLIRNGSWIWIGIVLLSGIMTFIYLVYQSRRTEVILNMQKTMWAINREEMLSLEGKFQNRPDGQEYMVSWSLDNDLDRFGKNSLYQLINRAESQPGRELMAQSLNTVPDLALLKLRQDAIQELSDRVDWRQQFRAHLMQNQITIQSRDILRYWMKSSGHTETPGLWKICFYFLPVISMVITLAYAFDFLPRVLFYSYLILAFIIAVYFGKIASEWFKHLSRMINELDTLLPGIRMIEEAGFTSPLLKELQLKLCHPEKVSLSLNALRTILARYDYRLNPIVYLPLNFFLWWDLRQIMALHQWRKSHRGNTDDWFEVIGQMESLNSYANLAFNKPGWVFPNLSDQWHEFKAEDLGHPLIPVEKAVTNDFILVDPHRIALITGSNMAGKSTFLRSIGANVLIAMAGGPVFASSCTLCPCTILSSMRISDNLQEETSTFYAELKKIKIILDAVKSKEKVMILVDEMLRGTNTLDREKGSRAFIGQLIQYNAVALIASHDTGLANIQVVHPDAVDNYFFDSVMEGESIRFDYKIKPGVCTQTNASYLMKKMGIELKED